MATQNPIEQEGTYNLPEAQLDRFMMKIKVDYPDFKSEKNILDLKLESVGSLKQMLDQELLGEIKKVVDEVYVDDKIKDFIVKTVHATRPGSDYFDKKNDGLILAGASPRASIWLNKVSKFKAFLNGKDYVGPDEIMSIVKNILGHRVIFSYEAIIDKVDSHKVIDQIASKYI
jgi:MoxR-like ATPase